MIHPTAQAEKRLTRARAPATQNRKKDRPD